MSTKNLVKVNDLSNSGLRKRFIEQEFIPASNQAIAFGRVSTKKQQDFGNSDLAQSESMTDYAKAEGLQIVQQWDVAETGSKHNKRNQFHDMIQYVKSNPQIKHVIFSHQSRSNRNRESARELELLVKLGVTIHFSRDRRKLTCQSDIESLLLWDVNNILNEKFIKDHTKNVVDGIIKRVELGLFPGKASLGYKNFRREDGLSIFVIDPLTASYVIKAFELFATGTFTEASLKVELDTKFPGMPRKPTSKRFGEILRNPFYYGKFIYDGVLYDGHLEYHPRLISYVLWKQVQDKLNAPHRSRAKVSKISLPYIGMMKCGGKILKQDGTETDECCGTAITAEEKRKKLANGSIKNFYYYHCSNTTRTCSQKNKGFLKAQGREKVSYSEAEIEELFVEVFKPLHFTDEVVKWMQDILLQQHRESSQCHKQHLSALQGRYKMLEIYIDKAYEDKLSGNISESMWKLKNNKWQEERQGVQEEINSLADTKDDYIEKGVLLIELAQRTESIYKNGSSEVKKKLVQAVSSNHVLRNGSICFDYKKPFDLLAKSKGPDIWWR